MSQVVIAAQSQVTNTAGQDNYATVGFLLVFIALIAFRRVYRGMHGYPFSTVRLLRTPVVYAILTALISVFLPLDDIFYMLSAGAIGLVAGFFFGDTATFYNQGGRVFYRRAPVILVIWLAAFIARIVIGLLISGSIYGLQTVTLAGVIVDLLLAGSTGLLAGETVRTYRKYSEHRDNAAGMQMMDWFENN